MGKLVAFVSMFTIVFFAIVSIAFFIPFLMAFIAWDTSFVNIDRESLYLFLRVNILLSTLMGIAFMLSKEGKAVADDFNQYIKSKRK